MQAVPTGALSRSNQPAADWTRSPGNRSEFTSGTVDSLWLGMPECETGEGTLLLLSAKWTQCGHQSANQNSYVDTYREWLGHVLQQSVVTVEIHNWSVMKIQVTTAEMRAFCIIPTKAQGRNRKKC